MYYSSLFLLLLLCLNTVHAQVELTGSGTAPGLLVSTMLLNYYSTDDGTTISYTEESYPTPINRFLNGETDFYVATQLIPTAQRTLGDCCFCDDITAIPIAVSGLTVIHSMGGWGASQSTLTLTRENLVKIYLGNITNWNQLNSAYPSATINVFYVDCAGSTDNFTPALKAINPTQWTQTCPSPFPIGTSTASDYTILRSVMSTPNSIGYLPYPVFKAALEEPYFSNQQFQLINKANFTIMPGTNSFFAAANDFAQNITGTTEGVVGTISDPPGPNSWPISYFEYVVLRSRNNQCDKLNSLFSFLVWGLSAREVLSSQMEPFGVARLPALTLERSLEVVNDFVCCTRLDVNKVITRGTTFAHQTFEDIAFTYLSSNTQLDDLATNSSDGLQQIAANTIDAALSITYPTASNLLPIRLFGAGISCVANINGLSSSSVLILDGATLGAIFQKTITSWSDNAIIALNSNISSLLSAAGTIQLQLFSDVDTRSIFSTAMQTFYSGFTGANLPGVEALGFPQRVLDNIASIVNSLGCTVYSKTLTYHPTITNIAMRNSFGTVLATPTSESILSAMNDFINTPASLLINGPSQNSWPISAYAYLVLNVDNTRCTQMKALAELVVWVFTRADAQAYLEDDGVSTPPDSVRTLEQKQLVAVTCDGEPLTNQAEEIYGVGGTFPLLVYQSWPLFYATRPDPVTNDPSVIVRVSYATSDQFEGQTYYGSALGEVYATNYKAQFGATDVPTVLDSSLSLIKVPTLAGGISIVFNLGPITSLTLSRQLLVKIFSGEVRYWNHSDFATNNPGITLPNAQIQLVYRAYASGSTYVMKKALQSFSSSSAQWNYEADEDPLTFPVASQLRGISSYDITSIIATHPYSLGYVEHSYALFSSIPYCSIINSFGSIVAPNKNTIESAMADFPLSATKLVTDLVDGPGEFSYPLASYTYVIVNLSWASCETSTRALSFLYSSIGESAPRARALNFGLVPLPNATLDLVEEELRKIKCEGNNSALPLIARGCDGIVGSNKKIDACKICGGNNETCCEGTPDQIALHCFSCDYFEGYPPFALNTYKCDGFLDCTGGEDDLDCDVSIIQTSIVLSVISGICIILCFIVGVDLFINRNERLFRENNVFFMLMILSGCIVGYATIFVLSQLTKLNNFVCGVQYWFFGVAFVLTFGSMIAKTYQVYMLHRQHSGDLSAYTNQAIVRYVAAAMLIEIIILLVWTAFDRPIPVLRHNDPSSDDKMHLICGNKHFTVFAILLALYKGIILVVGVVLSFLSRDIDFEGNESRIIRKTIISAALLAVVILPILIALGSSFPFVRILLSNVALLLIATLIMFTYFWPKLQRFHFSNGEGSYSELSKGMRLVGPIDI